MADLTNDDGIGSFAPTPSGRLRSSNEAMELSLSVSPSISLSQMTVIIQIFCVWKKDGFRFRIDVVIVFVDDD